MESIWKAVFGWYLPHVTLVFIKGFFMLFAISAAVFFIKNKQHLPKLRLKLIAIIALLWAVIGQAYIYYIEYLKN